MDSAFINGAKYIGLDVRRQRSLLLFSIPSATW